MLDSTIDELATYYVRYTLAEKDSVDARDLFWSWTLINDWADTMPELAWRFILSALRQDASNRLQERLSAGPLEDLLAKHGEAFIGRVEAQAANDPQFAQLLGGVWKNCMSDEVWLRVQRVWDRRGWDGEP